MACRAPRTTNTACRAPRPRLPPRIVWRGPAPVRCGPAAPSKQTRKSLFTSRTPRARKQQGIEAFVPFVVKRLLRVCLGLGAPLVGASHRAAPRVEERDELLRPQRRGKEVSLSHGDAGRAQGV